MTLVLVLAAIPLGWYVSNRIVGYLVYTSLQSFLFAFQTGLLILDWVGGDKSAFGPYPKVSQVHTWGYLVANTAIYALGLGVLALTYRLRATRSAVATSAAGPAHAAA